MDRPLFKLIALRDAQAFLDALPDKVREKVLYNIRKVRYGVQDKDLFKKLDEDIWEFRTLWQGIAYRLFAFWDTDGETLVIATHGIIKKSQKTNMNQKKTSKKKKSIKKCKKTKKIIYNKICQLRTHQKKILI